MSDNKVKLLELRNQLVKEIRQELLGPGSECLFPGMDIEHEIITDLPEARYSTGVLFPQGNEQKIDNDVAIDPDDTIEEIDETEAEKAFDSVTNETIEVNIPDSVPDDSGCSSFDDVIGLSSQNKPSSMGITFFIKGDVNSIKFDVSFATYRVAEISDCVVPYDGENADLVHVDPYVIYENKLLKLRMSINRKVVKNIEETDKIFDRKLIDALYKLANQCGKKSYVREPHSLTVDVSFDDGDYNDKNINLDDRNIKLTVIRRNFGSGVYAITAMLVNIEQGRYNGKNSIFQPKILVSSHDNNFIFDRYDNKGYATTKDEDEKSLALLYRNKKVFATGHGVSAIWDVDKNGNGTIQTEFLPVGIVKQIDFDLDGEKQFMSMKYLSDLNDDSVELKTEAIMKFLNEYKVWIEDIEIYISGDSEKLEPTLKLKAFEHIVDCKESLERMLYGLNLLKTNKCIFDAFQLANRAMFMQRIHAELQDQDKDSYPNDDTLQLTLNNLNYYNNEDKYWRPFQLAFLLMSLRSIVELESEERNLVDLIWFPTGGGKTEAYLGLTAFTIFYRKLVYPENSGGTAVIMRYTLRLLAAQQFVRASILICACEGIRKDCRARISKYPKYHLGYEEITIGLWIGGEHTPNKNKGTDERKGAKEFYDELQKAEKNNLKYVKEIIYTILFT